MPHPHFTWTISSLKTENLCSPQLAIIFPMLYTQSIPNHTDKWTHLTPTEAGSRFLGYLGPTISAVSLSEVTSSRSVPPYALSSISPFPTNQRKVLNTNDLYFKHPRPTEHRGWEVSWLQNEVNPWEKPSLGRRGTHWTCWTPEARSAAWGPRPITKR